MAPLPVSNTPRLFIDYTSVGQEHTAVIRLPLSAGTSEAIDAYNGMKAALLAITYTSDAIQGARFAGLASNLTFPLSVIGGVGTLSGTPDPDYKPNFASWTGRGGTGRRCRFTWFTAFVTPVSDGYRDDTPNAQFSAVRTALLSASVAAVDISGMTVFWNPYVNFGVNSYFQRKARRS